jgi:hypothetical protein
MKAITIKHLEPDISDCDPFKRLCAAIVLKAVHDAHSENLIKSLDAILWLLSDGEIYMDELGLNPDLPVRWITKGARLQGGITMKQNTKEDDIVKIFRGLSEYDARRLAERIRESLPTLRKNMFQKKITLCIPMKLPARK